MGNGRLSTVGVDLLFIHCTHVWPGEGCLMWGMLDSSLTFLPLSSLMRSKEGQLLSYLVVLILWLTGLVVLPLLLA